MNYGLIAIYDSDIEYANCLADYFRLKGCLSFEIVVFTRKDSFDSFVKEHNIDILIVDQKLTDTVNFENPSHNLFILCEHQVALQSDVGYLLFKYTSAEELLREIMANYEPTGSTPSIAFSTKQRTQIIGVYSPVCRCGKTSFSLSLAMQYGLKHSCLFLSMDEASPLRHLLYGDGNQTHSKSLDDLLYYYLQSPEVFESRLLSVVTHLNGVDIIPPSDKLAIYHEMPVSDWLSFLKHIINTERYDYIILDFGCISPVYPLLGICNRLYMPELADDEYARDKISLFMDSLHYADPDNNIHFQKVTLPNITYHGCGSEYTYALSMGELAHLTSTMITESDT